MEQLELLRNIIADYDEYIKYIAYFFMVIGYFCIATSIIGLFRMPDFFCKCHAAGVADTAGSILILASSVILFGITIASLKIIFLMLLMLITNPTSTYALTNAALNSGVVPQGKKIEK